VHPKWRTLRRGVELEYEAGQVHLKDIIDGQKHDDVLGQIEAKKIRYQRPKAKGKRCLEELPSAVLSREF
jgi:hypothetical protein